MDLPDYLSRQRQYDPQHPHSAAAAAAQARLRQRSSFGPDRPSSSSSASGATRSRDATPSPPLLPRSAAAGNHRSNTFGSFFDNDPIGVAASDPATRSPGAAGTPAAGAAAAASRLLPRATLASPAVVSQSSPLTGVGFLADDGSPQSAGSPLPAYSNTSAGRSSQTNFGPLDSKTVDDAGGSVASAAPRRPPPIRSQTGSALGSFSPFFDDDRTAAVLASPVDSPQSSHPLVAQHQQQRRQQQSPVGAARAMMTDDFEEGRSPLRSSTIAVGPSPIWASSAGNGNNSPGAGQAASSSASSSAADPWFHHSSALHTNNGGGGGASGRQSASPLVHSYQLPSRQDSGSGSSDSALWQGMPATASPGAAAASSRFRNSRGPPPRATTLANHESPFASSTFTTALQRSPTASHIHSAVAVTMEPDELHSSPMSTFNNIVDDPEEDEIGFGQATTADPTPSSRLQQQQQQQQRRLPPRMQTRLEQAARFRAPQRATTLDPASHLPRVHGDEQPQHQQSQWNALERGGPLSPVQDFSEPSSRQSTTATSYDQQSQARDQHAADEVAAKNDFAPLGGLHDGLRDVSPQRMSPAAGVSQQHQEINGAFGSPGAYLQQHPQTAPIPPPNQLNYNGLQGPFTSAPGADNFLRQQQQQQHHVLAMMNQQQQHGVQQQTPQHAFPANQQQQQLYAAMAGLDLNGRRAAPAGPTYGLSPGLAQSHHHHHNNIRSAPPAAFPPQHQHQQGQHPLPPHLQQQRPPYGHQHAGHPFAHQQNTPVHYPIGPGANATAQRGHNNGQRDHNASAAPLATRAGPTSMTPQSSSGTGPRSALLEEFRSKRGASNGSSGAGGRSHGHARHAPPVADATAHWSLDEIRGHVVEFCMDQHGSRFAQERLDYATPEQVKWVFEEIRPHARTLMQDVFGNYVVQKMFEYGSEAQRLSLTEEMRGHVMALSLGTYGCRVIQKALDHLPNYIRLGLAQELQGHVLELVQDQNANHVVQKLLSVVEDPESVRFVSDAFRGRVLTLGAHCYSCRVLQRVFERCGEAQARPLLTELHTGSSKLMADQYGNYVIQWILQRGDAQDKEKVIDSVVGSVLTLSRHKFASNVVEQVVRAASAAQRRQLAEEVLQPLVNSSHQPHSAVLGDPNMTAANVMMTDQYANYVLQRFLELCESDQKLRLVAILRPRLVALRRGAGGPGGWTKHLAAVERLVNEAASAAPGGDVDGGRDAAVDGLEVAGGAGWAGGNSGGGGHKGNNDVGVGA